MTWEDRVTLPGKRLFALRVVAGPFRGVVVPLEYGSDVLVGRVPTADVFLDDELISRNHARIGWEADVPVIEDLNSTNGTFVNGLRVQRWRLAHGDLVNVGGSILKLVGEIVPVSLAEARRKLEVELELETPEPEPAAAMQGRLEEVPLVDILQLLGTTRKTGVLVLRDGPRSAEVHFENGLVHRCTLDGRADLPAQAVIVRLLGWRAGRFRLAPATVPADGSGTAERVEQLLMEGLRQIDEAAKLASELPPDIRLAPASPLPGPTDQLSSGHQLLLEIASVPGTVEEVVDRAPMARGEAIEGLLALELAGYLRRIG